MYIINREKILVAVMLLLAIVTVKAQRKNDFVILGDKKAVVYDISFFKGGSSLAAATNNIVQIFNTSDQKLIRQFEAVHNNTILAIDVSADSAYLISGGRDGLIVLWDIENGEPIKKLNYHHGVITSVKFSPDGRYLVSGSSDNTIILYDLLLKEIKFTFTTHTDDITSVAFSPDGKTIASASADKSIKLWDTESGVQISSIDNYTGWPRSISFSPDNTKIIACGDDSKIIIWNVEDLKRIKKRIEFKSGSNWLLSVDFNADNKTFVTGSFSGKIEVFSDVTSYEYKLRKPINKIVFQPNQGIYIRLAVATMGNGIIFIDAKKMKLGNLN